jgi:hypothetical protein
MDAADKLEIQKLQMNIVETNIMINFLITTSPQEPCQNDIFVDFL